MAVSRRIVRQPFLSYDMLLQSPHCLACYRSADEIGWSFQKPGGAQQKIMADLNIEDDMTRAKRGLAWSRIEEALAGTGCPVCSQVEKSERHYLESMLYEYVLDAGVRKKLHQSHGFCSRHAGLAFEAEEKLNSDGLHLATMYESVMGEGLTILSNQIAILEEQAKEKNKRKQRKSVRTVHAAKCFVCDFAAETESAAVHGFLYFSRDKDLIEAYSASKAILCFRHVQMLVKDRAGIEVVTETLAKVQRLKGSLSEFIRKHDYQSEHDYTRDELQSFVSTVKFFAGRCR